MSACAGVKCTAIETEREGHAREVVQALSLAELQTYDGIVAVSDMTACVLPKLSQVASACVAMHGMIHFFR